MKPSKPTAITKNTFPQPFPDVVRAIMTAFYGMDVLERNAILSDAAATDTIALPAASFPAMAEIQMTHTVNVDTEIELFMPTKRVWVMTHALARTTAGSLLVSSEWVTSSLEIPPPIIESKVDLPEPDWSLLEQKQSAGSRHELEDKVAKLTKSLDLSRQHIQGRDSINTGIQAQLVAQDIIANKLRTALGEKERKTVNDATKLFKDGLAKLYTEDEVMENLREQKQARDEAERLKEKRAKARKQKKEAAEARDEAWRVMPAEYENAKKKWKLDNDTLIKPKYHQKTGQKLPNDQRNLHLVTQLLEEDDESGEDDSACVL